MQTTQTVTPPAEAVVPRAGKAAVPVWVIILLFLLLYWGMVYFDFRGGWFNNQVYQPFNSLQEVAAWQPPPPEGGGDLILGKKLFSQQCAVCHMENGVGNPGNGCPPLDGSEWVSAPGPNRLIRIVSKGLIGPIEVKGQLYNQGTMLAVGDQLPGDEKQKAESIAAILSYVRFSFGKKASMVTPEEVFGVREKIKDRKNSFTAEELKGVPEKK